MSNNSNRKKVFIINFIYFFATAILILPILKYYSLHSSYYDLGIIENILYRISYNQEWQLAFNGHVHGIALLYSLIYAAIPSTMTSYVLVGSQAFFLILPTYIIYRNFGWLSTLAYISFFPLWINNLFDFHFDHLSVLLLFGFYFSLVNIRIGYSIFFATLLILIKEPFALQTAACGILMIFAFFKKNYIWKTPPSNKDRKWILVGGIWLVLAGFGYFYFAINYLLPFFASENWGGALSDEAFGWLGGGLSEIAKTIIYHPNIIIWEIISTPSKLIYLTIVFGALAFIPLLKISLLIPIIPLLGIALLSRLSNYYDYNTHYMAGFIAPIIFSFAISIRRAEKIWVLIVRNCINDRLHLRSFFLSKYILINKFPHTGNSFTILLTVWIILCNIILSTSPISRIFWSNKSWSYSWSAYAPNERASIIKTAILENIPKDPSIIISTQNTLNWTHLAQRNIYLSFPIGINEPYHSINWSNRSIKDFIHFLRVGNRSKNSDLEVFAHYVLIDLKRPYFLVDQGCNWTYGKCQNVKEEKEFLSILESTKALYEIIYEYDSFMILKRKSL